MTPEKFLEEFFEGVSLPDWQYKFFIEFLNIPCEKREQIIKPIRGDGKSTTRLLLSIIHFNYTNNLKDGRRVMHLFE